MALCSVWQGREWTQNLWLSWKWQAKGDYEILPAAEQVPPSVMEATFLLKPPFAGSSQSGTR